jgi:16S rRNA (cytosine967-C5)-methyltransferase
MPISPARTAAFDILLRVEREQAYASELLHSNQYSKLSPVDHGLATEIGMGVLRWQSLLDRELARFSSQRLEKLDLEVLVSLRIAALQLMFLDRVPARAAVHESVELVKRARKRSAASFVNALLRKITGPTEPLHAPVEATALENLSDLADRYAHPLWMVERWGQLYGGEDLQRILRADQEIPVTTIRLTNSEDRAALEEEGIRLRNGQLLKQAARVESGDLTRTKAFRSRRIAIQDEGSQLVAMLVGRGQQILDCCAAPGGKTRILSDRNPKASITAVDIHPHRARLLRRLVPGENVDVLAADVRDLPFEKQFDRILVDAPCSGTGTLSRNPEIKWRLKPGDLLELQSRQISILQSAVTKLAPRGTLVYSTCSLEREENQDVIDAVLAKNTGFRVVDIRSTLEELRSEGELVWSDLDSLLAGPFLRTVPGVHPSDGFFAAIIARS